MQIMRLRVCTKMKCEVYMNTENLGNPDESKEFAANYEREMTVGSNDTIKDEIYQALGDKSGVDVHVNNGVVILTGAVDNDDRKAQVEYMVKNVPGVHEVINEITLKRMN